MQLGGVTTEASSAVYCGGIRLFSLGHATGRAVQILAPNQHKITLLDCLVVRLNPYFESEFGLQCVHCIMNEPYTQCKQQSITMSLLTSCFCMN